MPNKFFSSKHLYLHKELYIFLDLMHNLNLCVNISSAYVFLPSLEMGSLHTFHPLTQGKVEISKF